MKAKTFSTLLLAGATLLFAACDRDFADTRPEGRLVPPTVTEDPDLPSITVNGAMLHAEAFGHPDSALIVVVHGGPGSDYRYLLNCKAFADEGYHVVFYDQSGSGLSERFPKSHYQTVDLLIDELDGVIAHYRTSPTQKVFLLGHSWGAMLASAYVNKHLQAVDGVILCEPGGLIWSDIEAYIQRSQDFKLFSEALNDATFLGQLLTAKADEHEALDFKFDLFAASGDGKESPVGNEDKLPKWRSGAVVNRAYIELGNDIKPDFRANLGQYPGKILFVYSERNRAYGRDHALKVSSAWPNVQLFETLGAGHDMLSFPTGWSNTFPVMLDYLNQLR